MMKWIVPAATSMAIFASSAAFAQTMAPTDKAPASPPAATAPSTQPAPPAANAPMLTEEQAKALIDASVISSDNKDLGEVAAIQRDSDGKVTELHVDIGERLFGTLRKRDDAVVNADDENGEDDNDADQDQNAGHAVSFAMGRRVEARHCGPAA